MLTKTRFLTLLSSGVAALLTCVPAVRGQDPATAASHVIVNNDVYRAPNSATVFELSGGTLKALPEDKSTGWGLGSGFFGTNLQTVATVGSNVCVFVADPGSDDIAAFNSTNFLKPVHVGNFVDLTGSGAISGTALATNGTSLYAGYSASLNIAVWTINSDCSLTLANSASNTPTVYPPNDTAVTPDGTTLLVTYGATNPGIESFAISGATLTKAGSYNTTSYTAGIDVTKDSKFAIVGDFSSDLTQVEIFPINSDGTLGAEDYYNIAGGGLDSNNVWLSPDETVLYVSNNVSFQITMLNFKERASAGKHLTFNCLSTPLRQSAGGVIYDTGAIATSSQTSKGGYLYVAEWGAPSAVALLQIPATGCPVEVTGSPFLNSAGGFPDSLAAYPKRPF